MHPTKKCHHIAQSEANHTIQSWSVGIANNHELVFLDQERKTISMTIDTAAEVLPQQNVAVASQSSS